MRKEIWLVTCVLAMWLAVMLLLGVHVQQLGEVMPKGSVGWGRVQDPPVQDLPVQGEVQDVTLVVREGMPARAVVVGNYDCYELPEDGSKMVSYLSEGLIIRLTGIERGRWQFVMAGGDDWIKCWVKGLEFTMFYLW